MAIINPPITYVHDGNENRKLKSWYVHDGSEWRNLKKAYCHDGTEYRLVFAKDWIMLGSSIDFRHVALIDGVLYASGASGVFEWTGSFWNELGNLNDAYNTVKIGTSIYASCQSGIYYWNGSVWTKLGNLYNARHVTEIDGSIYAACHYYSTGSWNGVYYWTGTTWVRLGTHEYANYVAKIDGTIYRTNEYDGVYYWGGTRWWLIYYYADTWSTPSTFVTVINGTIYAGFSNGTFYWNGSRWYRHGNITSRSNHIKSINGLIYSAFEYSGVRSFNGSTYDQLGSLLGARHLIEVEGFIVVATNTGVYYWPIPILEM